MIKFKQKGDFKKTQKFFERSKKNDFFNCLTKYGDQGVIALKNATPKNSTKTSQGWNYSIDKTKKGITISWNNSDINNGVNIAIIIQYGHGTPSGYYVEGIDYINPALKPIFDEIGNQVWWEVTKNA